MFLRIYETSAIPVGNAFSVPLATPSGRAGFNHPAASHERGIANSDQPQSRHALTSGDGVIGGWLNVRGLLR
jgi:hypothetical protein